MRPTNRGVLGRTAARAGARITAVFALVAVAAGTALVPYATASPEDDRVKQAQAAEQAAAHSVADIEAKLAQVSQEVEQTRQESELADLGYNDAMSNLVVAQEAAKQAQAAKAKADTDVAKARKALTAIVRSAYTSHGSLSDLAPYLTEQGLESVEIRKVAVELFGARAQSQLRAFEEASKGAEVARVAAEQKLAEVSKYAEDVKRAKVEADAAAAAAQQKLGTLSSEHQQLLVKLAAARGVTLEAEQHRQAKLEQERAAREEAEKQAAIEAAKQRAAAAAAREEARRQQEAQAKAAEEAKAKAAAEARAKEQAAAQARAKAEAAAKEKAEAEARAKATAQAEAKARAAAQAKAKAEAAARAKAEADAKAKAAAKAKAQQAKPTPPPAPKPKPTPVPAPKPQPKPAPAPAPSHVSGDEIVAYALKFLGRPYVWGGNGPDVFDCSGLTRYVYSHVAGINLPRVSHQQGRRGVAVSPSQARPGDLLYWAKGHVAIYMGNGMMIHAPKPGDVVKVAHVYGHPEYRRLL